MTKRLSGHFQDAIYVPSQEGLIDAFKSFFGNDPQTSKPAVAEDKEEGEIDWSESNYLTRFLTSRTEVGKLVLKEGEIDGRWISRKLMGQDTTPDKVIPAMDSHVNAGIHVLSTAGPGIKNLLKFMTDNAQAIANADDSEEALYALVEKTGFDKLMPLKMSEAEFNKLLPSTEIYFHEHYETWMNLGQDRIVDTARRLPALTHEQIYKLGRLVQGWTKASHMLRMVPFDDSVLWGPYEGDRKPLEIYYDSIDAYDSREGYLFSAKLVTEYGWVYAAGEICETFDMAITAILTWIYRSINVSATEA